MAKKSAMIVEFEASKPDRGPFISFDSEGQAKIVVVVDASQRLKVEKLNAIPYGETFKLMIPFIKGN